jgi:hypothetical protein
VCGQQNDPGQEKDFFHNQPVSDVMPKGAFVIIHIFCGEG